jgi:glucan phosphoethanolaminetransferase (alkaline phosphatase superfamily)
MNRDSLARIVSVGALAIIFGLISARVPSISEAKPSFSWAGLFAGTGLVAGAFLLSRFFVAGAEANAQRATPLQRSLINSALVCFLVALVLFVAILYTHWAWPRLILPIVVGCGALSVFAGVVTTFLRRSN